MVMVSCTGCSGTGVNVLSPQREDTEIDANGQYRVVYVHPPITQPCFKCNGARTVYQAD